MSEPRESHAIQDELSIRDTEVAVGDVLAGKYRVDSVLGVGGMGVVVAATHTELGEKVALKFLATSVMSKSSAVVTRFLREARAAVKIKSEHVAAVRDTGTLESGNPFIVMEYLDGADLSRVIQTGGAVMPRDAVDYVVQACEALAQAHALGIIHRDLKPSNLFLSRRADGSALVKVLDFGISRILTGDSLSDASLTQTDTLLGSPMFMAPELWQSAKNASEISDVWSLGAVLYELLTGHAPFPGGSMAELCRAILSDTPAPPSSYNPDIDPTLDAVVLKTLEKSPSERLQNVAELAAALVPFGRTETRIYARRIIGVLKRAQQLDHIPTIVGDSQHPASATPHSDRQHGASAGGLEARIASAATQGIRSGEALGVTVKSGASETVAASSAIGTTDTERPPEQALAHTSAAVSSAVLPKSGPSPKLAAVGALLLLAAGVTGLVLFKGAASEGAEAAPAAPPQTSAVAVEEPSKPEPVPTASSLPSGQASGAPQAASATSASAKARSQPSALPARNRAARPANVRRRPPARPVKRPSTPPKPAATIDPIFGKH